MKKKNLLKLADFLDTLQDGFDMLYFGKDRSGVSCWKPYEMDCCTVCCALGHAANLFENDATDFGRLCYDLFGIVDQGLAWYWCFAGLWKDYDNTPFGAAKRIRYLATHGSPPETFTRHNFEPFRTGWELPC